MICKKCDDEHYLLIGCCSGAFNSCGCMGQPVEINNCKQCNPDGNKSMGDYVSGYAEFLEYVKV